MTARCGKMNKENQTSQRRRRGWQQHPGIVRKVRKWEKQVLV